MVRAELVIQVRPAQARGKGYQPTLKANAAKRTVASRPDHIVNTLPRREPVGQTQCHSPDLTSLRIFAIAATASASVSTSWNLCTRLRHNEGQQRSHFLDSSPSPANSSLQNSAVRIIRSGTEQS